MIKKRLANHGSLAIAKRPSTTPPTQTILNLPLQAIALGEEG